MLQEVKETSPIDGGLPSNMTGVKSEVNNRSLLHRFPTPNKWLYREQNHR